MIVTIKDKDDRVTAYAEFRLVDHAGRDCEVGRWIWIGSIWVHKSIQRQGMLKKLLRTHIGRFPTAKWIYFRRHKKYGGRMRQYDIRRMI